MLAKRVHKRQIKSQQVLSHTAFSLDTTSGLLFNASLFSEEQGPGPFPGVFDTMLLNPRNTKSQPHPKKRNKTNSKPRMKNKTKTHKQTRKKHSKKKTHLKHLQFTSSFSLQSSLESSPFCWMQHPVPISFLFFPPTIKHAENSCYFQSLLSLLLKKSLASRDCTHFIFKSEHYAEIQPCNSVDTGTASISCLTQVQLVL